MPSPIYFKRKHYGWGWYPSTWQGWLITLGYVAFVLGLSTFVPPYIPTLTNLTHLSEQHITLLLASIIFLATTILIYLCFRFGETPRWQWGERR